MRAGVKAAVGAVLLGVCVLLFAASPRPGLVDPPPPVPPADADAWLADKVAESASIGVSPQGKERIARATEGRSEVAFLFVHGFGATRGEGEYVVDAIAQDWSANVYYARLPGHGQDKQAHAAATAEEWLAASAEALGVANALGDRVVVVGASTGSAIATWLAATYPDRVHALILTSPFYDYPEGWTAPLLNSRGGVTLASLALGRERDCNLYDPRKQPGYEDHWQTVQMYSILGQLERLRRHCARPEVFAAVTQPTLMMMHYASYDEHDTVVSIPAMRAAYASFNGGRPHSKSRLVAVRDGNHVLLSEYVRTDKQAVRMAIDVFLNQVLD